MEAIDRLTNPSRAAWALVALGLFSLVFRAFGTWEVLDRGFVGIAETDGLISVVHPGMPAHTVGLKVGDRILEVQPGDRPSAGASVTYVIERDGKTRRFEMRAARMSQPTLGWTLATALMGLFFLASGVLVLILRPGWPARLWLLYGVGEVLHWGGWPASGSAMLGDLFISIVMLGTMLGGAAILHLALLHPEPWPLALRPWVPRVIWGSLVLAALIALAKAPLAGQPAHGALTAIFFLAASVQAYLFTILALVVLILRRRRIPADRRRSAGLGWMITGLVGGSMPYLLVSLIEAVAPNVPIPGGSAFPYTLGFALISVGFTIGLLQSRPTSGTAARVS